MRKIIDPYFQISDFTIPVAGLKESVEIMQISDLHISHADADSSEERKEKVERQKNAWEPVRRHFANRYGDSIEPEHMIDPEEGWQRIISAMNQSRPDAVIFNGDMMEDYSPENLRFLSEGLRRIEIPWMWVCGNHERGHDDEYAPWMDGHPDCQLSVVKGLQFIGINNADKQVTDDQLAKILSASVLMPSVLVMHIPMLTKYNKEATAVFGEYFLMGTGEVCESTRRFIEYMEGKDNPIAAVLCGHVHGKHISEYRPGKVQICASSCMVGSCNRIRFIPAE